MKKLIILAAWALAASVSAQEPPVERLPVGEDAVKEALIKGVLTERQVESAADESVGHFVLELMRVIDGEARVSDDDIRFVDWTDLRLFSYLPNYPEGPEQFAFARDGKNEVVDANLYIPIYHPRENPVVPTNMELAVELVPDEPTEASLRSAVREKSRFLLDFFKENGSYLTQPPEPGEYFFRLDGSSFHNHGSLVLKLIEAKTPVFEITGTAGNVYVPDEAPDFEYQWGRYDRLYSHVPVSINGNVELVDFNYTILTPGIQIVERYRTKDGLVPTAEVKPEEAFFIGMHLLWPVGKPLNGWFPYRIRREDGVFRHDTLSSEYMGFRGTVTLTMDDGNIWVYALPSGELVDGPGINPDRRDVEIAEASLDIRATKAGTYSQDGKFMDAVEIHVTGNVEEYPTLQASNSLSGEWNDIAIYSLEKGSKQVVLYPISRSQQFFRLVKSETGPSF